MGAVVAKAEMELPVQLEYVRVPSVIANVYDMMTIVKLDRDCRH